MDKQAMTTAFRRYISAVSDYFGLFESEVAVVIDDYADRVESANNGDPVAAKKLMAYLRHCLLSGKVPDPLVAQWASRCLFEVVNHGISADKAFSLSPETGRPPKGGRLLESLIIWECVEVIRHTHGGTKTEAIAAYHEEREALAAHLWQQHREVLKIESQGYLTNLYRQGARLVRQYQNETGQQPPAF